MNGIVEGCDWVSGVVVVVPAKRGRRLRSRACSGRTDACLDRVSQAVGDECGSGGQSHLPHGLDLVCVNGQYILLLLVLFGQFVPFANEGTQNLLSPGSNVPNSRLQSFGAFCQSN
jgi:hypothetical protein